MNFSTVGGLMLALMIGKAIAFVRDPVLAARFGASSATDVLFLTLSAAFIALNVVGVPFQVALQHQFAIWSAAEEDSGAQLRAMRGPVIVTCAAGAMVAAVASTLLLRADPDASITANAFILLLAAASTGFGITASGIGAAQLASQGRFLRTAVATIITNGLLIALLFVVPVNAPSPANLLAAAFGLVFALQGLVMLNPLRTRTRDSPLKFWNRHLLNPSLGSLGSAAFSQGAQVLMSATAVGFGAGVLSSLTYGLKVDMGVYEIVALSLSSMFFPMFVRHSVSASRSQQILSADPVLFAIKVTMIIIVPAAVILALDAPLVIRLLFERQAFGAAAAQLAAESLAVYAMALPSLVVIELTSKRLISDHRSMGVVLPFATGIATNIFVVVVLRNPVGPMSIPLGFASGGLVAAALLVRATVPRLTLAGTWKMLGLPLSAGAISAVPIVGISSVPVAGDTFAASYRLLEVSFIATAAYCLAAYLLASNGERRSTRLAAQSLVRRLGRFGQVGA